MPRSLFVAFLCCSSLALAAPVITPTAALKQKNGDLDKLLRQNPPKGTPAETKQKDEIKTLAGTLLDYSELTRRAMADHWAKISAAQQKDLVETLKELIERNYVKQVKSNLDYQVTYKDEKITGEEALVNSVVKVKTKGKSTDADIVYRLRKAGDQWLVWDVITDEVSLMKNYKSQFNKIITESGFDELLKKMKKRLNEKEDKS